jgi:Cu+-exporting ATPase
VYQLLFAGLVATLVPFPAVGQTLSGANASGTVKLQITQCALKVSGMTCGGCAGLVEKGLLKVEGVKTAKVDFKTGEVRLVYDSKKTNPEKVVASFNQANPRFHAEQAKASPK